MGAVIGSQATNYSITFNGAFKVYVYGVTLRNGTNTNSSKNVAFGGSDGGHFEGEAVSFTIAGGAASALQIGGGGTTTNSYVRLIGGTWTLGNAGHQIRPLGRVDADGITLAGTDPTVVFAIPGSGNGINWTFNGSDLSAGSATLVGDAAGFGSAVFTFVNCQIPTGTIVATPTIVLNKGHTTVNLFNCASADTHYNFYHGDAFGETTAVVTYYADDGASYDGTNKVSWKIVTRASNCSFFTPYVSPWIEQYNADLSTAITPYLEGLRVDSTTIIQDDEVWAEFSVQDTANVPLAVITSDRMALLGTPANQTSSLAYTAWTGSPTDTDSADSTFKLQAPAAVTPNEIGPLKARVVVGEPGLTVYIDPKIRV